MFLTDLLEERPRAITVLYGPAASGKSTLALETLDGRSVIIASRRAFSPERLRDLRIDAATVLERTVLFEPEDLVAFERAIDHATVLAPRLGTIVIDSLGPVIRGAERTAANYALGRVLAKLALVPCPVIIVTDALDRPVKDDHELRFVGGDALRLHARTIIELADGIATVKKHPALAGRAWRYRITAAGLVRGMT
jgi:hypothetical protein